MIARQTSFSCGSSSECVGFNFGGLSDASGCKPPGMAPICLFFGFEGGGLRAVGLLKLLRVVCGSPYVCLID